ncbi:MAG TPA: hypothetical protein VH210_15000 [Gaiellaceae bacterium]|jgi:hypothetical protein|nr:hypothetical protein [Gaiellaceae bacterium]
MPKEEETCAEAGASTPTLVQATLREASGFAEVIESIRCLQLVWSNWQLLEEAEYQADLRRHAGHDPDAVRFGFCDEARVAIARMLPPGYPLSTERLLAGEDHRAIAEDVLRTICSYRDGSIVAVVGRAADALVTVEAEVEANRDWVDERVRLCRIDSRGRRAELAVVGSEDAEEHELFVWLLEEGIELVAGDRR